MKAQDRANLIHAWKVAVIHDEHDTADKIRKELKNNPLEATTAAVEPVEPVEIPVEAVEPMAQVA